MSNISKDYGYPTASVIWLYALCGGAVGGIVVGLYSVAVRLIEGNINLSAFRVFGVTIFFGCFVGLIPATIAGLWIARTRCIIKNTKDYLKIAMTGYLSTFACIGLITLISSTFAEMISPANLKFLFIDSSVGAISAVIVGKLGLPRT